MNGSVDVVQRPTNIPMGRQKGPTELRGACCVYCQHKACRVEDFLPMAEFAVNNTVDGNPFDPIPTQLRSDSKAPTNCQIGRTIDIMHSPRTREMPAGSATWDGIERIIRANVLKLSIVPNTRPEACLALRLWVTTLRGAPTTTKLV
jgi:hypothetical protein